MALSKTLSKIGESSNKGIEIQHDVTAVSQQEDVGFSLTRGVLRNRGQGAESGAGSSFDISASAKSFCIYMVPPLPLRNSGVTAKKHTQNPPHGHRDSKVISKKFI